MPDLRQTYVIFYAISINYKILLYKNTLYSWVWNSIKDTLKWITMDICVTKMVCIQICKQMHTWTNFSPSLIRSKQKLAHYSQTVFDMKSKVALLYKTDWVICIWNFSVLRNWVMGTRWVAKHKYLYTLSRYYYNNTEVRFMNKLHNLTCK